MSYRKGFFMGITLSLVAILLLLVLTGAVAPKSPNYHSLFRSNSSLEIECSSDGSIVYIADETRILRSKDFGNNWEIIMTSDNREVSYKQK